MKDYYDVLEVQPDATPDEIKFQYRFLLNAWHPDKHSNPEHKAKAEARTKVITEAYGILGDPVKRAQYDRERFAGSPQADQEDERRKGEQAQTAERRRAEEERQWRYESEARADQLARAEAERQQHEAAERARRLAIDWITVPAGEFLYSDNKERKSLTAFRIARYPVTNAQYAEFVMATHSPAPGHWPNGEMPVILAEYPVINVDWNDAQAYCRWAKVRLPTEQEWEKAARGADGRIYPWGNQPPTPKLSNFNNNIGTVTPVGTYSPEGDSPYGCADMAGNVWEWTISKYDAWNYVLRGGSWLSSANFARAARRNRSEPTSRYNDFGFRCAISP